MSTVFENVVIKFKRASTAFLNGVGGQNMTTVQGEPVVDKDKALLHISKGGNFDSCVPVDFRVNQEFTVINDNDYNINFNNTIFCFNCLRVATGNINLGFLNYVNGSNFNYEVIVPSGSSDITFTINKDPNNDATDDYDLALYDFDTDNSFLLEADSNEDRHYTISGFYVPASGNEHWRISKKTWNVY